ncbi:MAG: DUF2304 domain-containing protein [Chloroflexi bacterium]|nr:DUF2304 domain-containing protein [Chloroflexota bacterium]
MTVQGVIVFDLVIAALLVYVLYLLARNRMYVGYGVIWLAGLIGAAVLVTIEPVQALFTRAIGAVFPASALAMAAFGFIILLLIYFSVQVTVLADRVTQLSQHIALQELRREQEAASAPPRDPAPPAP